jgi:PPOX class probable F420-dependent enzyme
MPILDHTPAWDHIVARLRDDVIAWLGTVRPDGRPHLVPVWFAWDGAALFVLSEPDTQKVRNIKHDRRVTVALDDSRRGHDVVLFEGEAVLLEAPAVVAPPVGYVKKYAGLLAEMEWPVDEMIADYSQTIRILPTRFITW